MQEPAISRVGWRRVLTLDEALLVQITRLQAPRLTSVMLGFTRLGDAESWFLLWFALLAVDGLPLALRLAAGALGATLPTQVLKRLLRRSRPTKGIVGFAALDPDPDAFSFPSGHTATAFGVALSLLTAGSPLAGPALVLATGIGASRVYLGAHYPLDVAVGAMLGTFGAGTSILLLG